MVLPSDLLRIYEEKLWFISSTVSRIDQAILYYFMKDGHFERYLNKMRKIYKGKHDLVMEYLEGFEKVFDVSGEYAGLHVLLKDKREWGEEKLLQAAEEADCRVYGMSSYVIGEKQKADTVIIGYGGMAEEQITEGMERLKKAWRI